MGKISKQILDKFNTDIETATKLNHWKNTDEVIRWFNNVKDKQTNAFICFYVCELYPSITEELLGKAFKLCRKLHHNHTAG